MAHSELLASKGFYIPHCCRPSRIISNMIKTCMSRLRAHHPIGTRSHQTSLRISGPGSVAIVAENFRPRARFLRAKSHTVLHGIFHDRAGIPLGRSLCTVFRAPTSYTGEKAWAILHGNPLIARRIWKHCS
jgi:hypothetical protein